MTVGFMKHRLVIAAGTLEFRDSGGLSHDDKDRVGWTVSPDATFRNSTRAQFFVI